MGDSEPICNRREPRYRICDGQELACDTAFNERLHEGAVVDVSSMGMRVRCDGKFKVGLPIAIELKTDRSHGIYGGTIRRVEPWVAGQSVLGCQLDDPIPDEVLEELASTGIVNRRCDERVTWDKTAAMSWELQPGEIEIEIRDYSPGGMRVYAETPIPEHVRLRIRVETEDEEDVIVAATSVWKVDSNEGCHAGLAFTSSDAPRQLADAHHGLAPESNTDGARPRLRVGVAVMAAVVLLTVAAVKFTPLLELGNQQLIPAIQSFIAR